MELSDEGILVIDGPRDFRRPFEISYLSLPKSQTIFCATESQALMNSYSSLTLPYRKLYPTSGKAANRAMLCLMGDMLKLIWWIVIGLFRSRASLTWGGSGQEMRFIRASIILQRLFRYPRSEPDCTAWSFPRQINLTFRRRSRRLHQYPACGGRGSGRRNHSRRRLFKPCEAAVRPPGSARTDQVLEDLRIQ